MMNKQKILILSPHTDDGELGCGGSINRFVDEGKEVHYIAFSICEESVPEGLPKDTLKKECEKATATLGIKPENVNFQYFPVRKFNFHRQEILEVLIQFRNKLKPDLVFMPSSTSIHQDHITIYNEGIRAFKTTSCLGYDLPWDSRNFPTKTFIKLDKKNIDVKWNALLKYESQGKRDYFDKEFIVGLSRVRGAQIAKRYAEAFEVINWIE